MAASEPPVPTPDLAHSEENPVKRIHFRLSQIVAAALTLCVTVWLWVLHPVAGIIASFLAKHVLVAILCQNLDMHSGPGSRRGSSSS